MSVVTIRRERISANHIMAYLSQVCNQTRVAVLLMRDIFALPKFPSEINGCEMPKVGYREVLYYAVAFCTLNSINLKRHTFGTYPSNPIAIIARSVTG